MTKQNYIRIMNQRARTARYVSTGEPLSQKQRTMIVKGFEKMSRSKRLSLLSLVLSRKIVTTNDLLKEEASLIISELPTPEFKELINNATI